MTLAACDNDGQANSVADPRWKEPGWHYRFEGDRGAALYRLDNSERSYFIAMCDRDPLFSLNDTATPPGIAQYTLTIDGKSWRKPINLESGFLTSDPQLTAAFAAAKRRITYRAGDRMLADFTPNAMIKRLIDDCHRSNPR